MNKQYAILQRGKPVVIVDDIQTAIQMVQRLEANMDRYQSHSPYTIDEHIEEHD